METGRCSGGLFLFIALCLLAKGVPTDSFHDEKKSLDTGIKIFSSSCSN